MTITDVLSSPISNSLISIAGILISIFISYVLYRRAIYKRKPRFAFKPAEVIADISGTPPDFHIVWKKRNIENVITIKIAFWNQGTQSIRRQDISSDEPITIQASENVNILAIKELSKSRDTLSFQTYKRSNKQKGDFIELIMKTDDALEKNDGICFLILYTGSSKVKWFVSARIFDVPKGFKLKSVKDSQSIRIISTFSAAAFGGLITQLFISRTDVNLQTVLFISIALVIIAIGTTFSVFYLLFVIPSWLRKLSLQK